jgi:FtsZ-binding cell division protein ZapB
MSSPPLTRSDFLASSNRKHLEQIQSLKKQVEELKKENEKLKKENEELTKSVDDWEEQYNILQEEHAKPFSVYFGSKAYKVDLPCQERCFETLDDARKYIDDINNKGHSSIIVSYDNIDYHPYIDE